MKTYEFLDEGKVIYTADADTVNDALDKWAQESGYRNWQEILSILPDGLDCAPKIREKK